MTQASIPFDPRNTQEYRELGFKIVTCPVCGKETLDDYFICPTCGWEYDGTTKESTYSSCNKSTIAEYKVSLLGEKKMNTVWVLSVRTSLPTVCEHPGDLKLEMLGFESFEKAKATLREKLKELAFATNSMFDGNGNVTLMKKYMEEKKDYGDSEDDSNWLSPSVGAKLLSMFHAIFSGYDVPQMLKPRTYEDGLLAVDLDQDSIAFRGIDDGPINGYDPIANTNMLSLTEEKDYYLYINDLFGWSADEASSELYIDLRKIEVQ